MSAVEVGRECWQNVPVIGAKGSSTTATERVWDDELGTNILNNYWNMSTSGTQTGVMVCALKDV